MRVGQFAVVIVLSCSVFAAGSPAANAQESQLDGLRSAAKASAGDPAAALALGRALRRAGHPVDALNELHRGIALSASKPDLLLQLRWEVARVHIARRDFGQTMTACRVLGSLPGGAAQGHACAAEAHLVWQRATEALVEVAAALTKDPHCFEAKLAEARAYDFALETSKSEAAFRTALAWRPDAADAHLGLGRLLVKDGRRDDGVAEPRRAVQLDPSGPDALYELGVTLPVGDERTVLLERATHERASFTAAWLALGLEQFAAGRLVDAHKSADQAVRGDPGSTTAHVLLGKVALAEGRPDDAIKEAEAALKIVANVPAAKLLVGDANAKKGEIDRAVEAYQAAWGLDHGDPTPLVHAAEACHAAGRDTSARAFGVRVTQEFPKWGPGWVALGDALAAQGEKQEARNAYQRALAGEGPIDRAGIERKVTALQ